MSHSPMQTVAHAAHALHTKEGHALAVAAGGLALKGAALALTVPVLGPLAVAGVVGATGYSLVKWLGGK